MEMESSRRSIDRSREPGMKKPRLAEDQALDRDRPFPARASTAAGVGPLISRFRANEREGREDSIRGGGAYQQQLEEQEIVAQYKTALSELTFNSKPIITNLTIIAGENTQAAKGIADVICANILEVPSDQKLPSLYLLDSIVKNIGRDYIRYFAARLPEVFCKAYKQVDPSIHSGMRHLFGTWKGVFPHPALQIIQKELAFPPVANGSTSGAVTSRPDSQSQRPPHSIHVNPKYLEARQRLQQTRAKGANIEDSSKTLSTADDAERSDRTAITGSGRTWTDLPVKMPNIQHSQRDRPNEPVREKSMGTGYGGDYEFDSDLPSQLDPGIGKASKRVSEREALDTPSYGTGRSMANKTGLSQRNGFDASNAYVNYRERDPRSTRATTQHPTQTMTNRSSQGTPENWKNSEEEEYMWEDMNSRLIDQSGTDSPRKDSWSAEEAEKPLKNQPKGKWMPLETELLDTSRWNTHDTLRMDKHSGSEERNPLQREVEEHLQPFDRQDFGSRAGRETSTSLFGQSAFRHRNPSLWSSQDLPPIGGLNHTSIASNPSGQMEGHPTLFSRNLFTSLSSSLNRKVLNPQAEPFASVNSGFGSHPSAISGSSETFGHQRKQSLGPPSPSAPSAMHHQPHSPSSSASLTEHNHAQAQSVSVPSKQSFHVPEQLNRGSHVQINRDSSPVAPQRHAQPMHNSPLPFSQPLKHVQSSSPPLQPFTHQRHHQALSQQPESEPSSSLTQNLPPYKPPSVGPPLAVGYSELGLSKNPSEALGQSNTSSLLAAFVKGGLAVNLSAASGVSNSSNLELSHRTTRPPLPTGPPPASSTPMAEGTSHGNLSSLVTSPLSAVQPPLPPGPPPSSSLKGTSSQVSNTSSAVPNPVSNLLSTLVAEGLISVPPTELVAIGGSQLPTHLQNRSIGQSKSSSILVSSSSASSALPPPLPDNENSRAVSNQKSASLSQAAAIELKHLIGVEFKPEVIRGIHPTVINALVDDLPHQCCICGLRFKLQEQLSIHLDWHNAKKLELSSCNEVSRKWYASLGDWVAGNAGLSLGPSTTMEEGTASVEEKSEPMVPADESQSICILCGEPFEDWYSEERDEWMYKGAVYMPTTAGEGDLRDTHAGRPIVHPNCISGSLRDDC